MKYNDLRLIVDTSTPTNLEIEIYHGDRLAYVLTITKDQALKLARDLKTNSKKIDYEPSGSSEIPNYLKRQ